MPEMTPLEAAEILESSINIHGPVKVVTDELLARAVACDYLRKIAAGERRPVIHAHWIEDTPFSCRCSECDYGRYGLADQQERYCPNCGALMDESRDGNSHDGKDDSHE